MYKMQTEFTKAYGILTNAYYKNQGVMKNEKTSET